MVLEVQRAGGNQGVALPQGHEARRPAGAWGGAVAGLQGGQVLVAHEGRGVALLGQQGVPGRSIHVQRSGKYAGDNGRFSHARPGFVLQAAGPCGRCSTWPQGPIPVP